MYGGNWRSRFGFRREEVVVVILVLVVLVVVVLVLVGLFII